MFRTLSRNSRDARQAAAAASHLYIAGDAFKRNGFVYSVLCERSTSTVEIAHEIGTIPLPGQLPTENMEFGGILFYSNTSRTMSSSIGGSGQFRVATLTFRAMPSREWQGRSERGWIPVTDYPHKGPGIRHGKHQGIKAQGWAATF